MTNPTPPRDDAPELLPCPFCGQTNVKIFGPVGWYRNYGVTHSCSVFFGGSGDFTIGSRSKSGAAAAWNRRADQPARVGALVWRPYGRDGQGMEASALGLEVFCRIDGKPGDWTLTSPGATAYVHTPGYNTRADAQAAAQADYERRILSALLPTEAGAEPVAWQSWHEPTSQWIGTPEGWTAEDCKAWPDRRFRPLYTTPPAAPTDNTALVEALGELLAFEEWQAHEGGVVPDRFVGVLNRAISAHRAALRREAPQAVTVKEAAVRRLVQHCHRIHEELPTGQDWDFSKAIADVESALGGRT